MRKKILVFVAALMLPCDAQSATTAERINEVRKLFTGDLRASHTLRDHTTLMTRERGGENIFREVRATRQHSRLKLVQTLRNRGWRVVGTDATVVIADRFYYVSIFQFDTLRECFVSFYYPHPTSRGQQNFVKSDCTGEVLTGIEAEEADPDMSRHFVRDHTGQKDPIGYQHKRYWQEEFDRLVPLILPVLHKHEINRTEK